MAFSLTSFCHPTPHIPKSSLPIPVTFSIAVDKVLFGLIHAVQHPSLASAREVASKQMSGFGGCFALELSTEAAAKALPAALKLFRSATSLGGVDAWLLLDVEALGE